MKNITILTLAVSILLLPAACKKAPIEGRVHFVVGDVSLNGHPAAKDEAVLPGDVIETKADSSCEIIVAGKNILSIAPESRLVYNLRQGDGRLELSRGGFGALLRNKLPFGDFTISTRTVTASIRGTAFYMAAESGEKTYACVCNGRIRFRPEGGGKEETVSSSHHAAYNYTMAKGVVAVDKGKLLYHDDKSMEKLATDIGEKIDWTHVE